MLPHGEWSKWLEEKVEFSSQTANKFMKVANEMPHLYTSRNLNISKIYELLSLPASEREEFIETNPVEDMTTRELREAIREKKQLEREKEQINRVNDDLRKEINELRNKPPNVVEKEVRECEIKQCSLWRYRMGKEEQDQLYYESKRGQKNESSLCE